MIIKEFKTPKERNTIINSMVDKGYKLIATENHIDGKRLFFTNTNEKYGPITLPERLANLEKRVDSLEKFNR